MPIKSIRLNIVFRLILLAVLAGVVFLTYFALKWTFGRTVAVRADSKDVAEIAVRFAPDDPQTYFSAAVFYEKSLLPEDLKKALENYEKAVSVSPHDFRLWLALGKARERTGDVPGAEKALRKSLELAPNYAENHWVLGNFLLRQQREEEAFAEISKAVETNDKYAGPAVATAWDLFDGDLNQIAQKIGNSAAIKAQFPPFLVKQKRFDEAFNFWNAIPDEEKRTTYRKNGEEFANQLIEAKNFRHALTVQSQIAKPEDEKFSVGVIYNPDFEQTVKPVGANVFDWQIGEKIQPQISLDASQKQSGSRSLIMLFNSGDGKDLRTIQQTVAVESGKNYKLEGFYRTDLKTLSSIKVEIFDGTNGNLLASSEANTAAKDWQPFSLGFTTPANTQGLTIRLGSVSCKTNLCPVTGKIWYDNLSLK